MWTLYLFWNYSWWQLIARGIEIRRHDAPNFIKQFQTELLYTLFDCNDLAQVFSKGYESALFARH